MVVQPKITRMIGILYLLKKNIEFAKKINDYPMCFAQAPIVNAEIVVPFGNKL